MRVLKLSVLIFTIILFAPHILEAEVVQLVGQSTEVKPDEIKSLNDNDLKEIKDIKISLITFIKAPIKSKTTHLSSKFKKIYKNTEEVLSTAFDKEAYLKLDIRRTEYWQNNATVKANLYWVFEGYEGLQIFYFMFVKENEKWLIDWMVH